jgi:hypothetical protein
MASILLHLKNRTDAAGSIWESEAVQHNGGRPLYSSVLGLAGELYRQPGAWFVRLTSERVSKQQGEDLLEISAQAEGWLDWKQAYLSSLDFRPNNEEDTDRREEEQKKK